MPSFFPRLFSPLSSYSAGSASSFSLFSHRGYDRLPTTSGSSQQRITGSLTRSVHFTDSPIDQTESGDNGSEPEGQPLYRISASPLDTKPLPPVPRQLSPVRKLIRAGLLIFVIAVFIGLAMLVFVTIRAFSGPEEPDGAAAKRLSRPQQESQRDVGILK